MLTLVLSLRSRSALQLLHFSVHFGFRDVPFFNFSIFNLIASKVQLPLYDSYCTRMCHHRTNEFFCAVNSS